MSSSSSPADDSDLTTRDDAEDQSTPPHHADPVATSHTHGNGFRLFQPFLRCPIRSRLSSIQPVLAH